MLVFQITSFKPTRFILNMTLFAVFVPFILVACIKTTFGTLVHSNDIAPDASLLTDLNFNYDPEAQSGVKPSSALQWNADYYWSPAQFNAAEDAGIQLPEKRAAQNFIRLGRTRNNNAFMRLGRNNEQGFIRFGRSNETPNNVGRRDNGFLRFGRDSLEHLQLPGGTNEMNDDNMRFGRRGDKFIRFGRSQADGLKDSGRNYQNGIDRENIKRYEEIGGKAGRAQSYRLGRSRLDNNFIRLGKKSNIDSVHFDDLQSPSSNSVKEPQIDNDYLTPTTSDNDIFDNFNQKHGETSQRITENEFSSEK